MKINELVEGELDNFDLTPHVALGETTSAGSVAAVAAPMGKLQKRNMYNADGTMKNALDTDSLLGGSLPKKNKTSKKA